MAAEPGPTQRRRRGALLETSLLAAAWEELAEVGYARLTMEGVATRAHTGKQVLYRRWHNRAELVLAALRHHGGSLADQIPDTGELRGDVLAVLRHMVRRRDEFGPDVVHGLLSELPSADLETEFEPVAIMRLVMTTIIDRATARGEIGRGRLSPRALTLPVDLLRHELLLSRRPISDQTLTDIVDQVYLPLLRDLVPATDDAP